MAARPRIQFDRGCAGRSLFCGHSIPNVANNMYLVNLDNLSANALGTQGVDIISLFCITAGRATFSVRFQGGTERAQHGHAGRGDDLHKWIVADPIPGAKVYEKYAVFRVHRSRQQRLHAHSRPGRVEQGAPRLVAPERHPARHADYDCDQMTGSPSSSFRTACASSSRGFAGRMRIARRSFPTSCRSVPRRASRPSSRSCWTLHPTSRRRFFLTPFTWSSSPTDCRPTTWSNKAFAPIVDRLQAQKFERIFFEK